MNTLLSAIFKFCTIKNLFKNNMQTTFIGLNFHQLSNMIHQLSCLGGVKRKIDQSEKNPHLGEWIWPDES